MQKSVPLREDAFLNVMIITRYVAHVGLPGQRQDPGGGRGDRPADHQAAA